MLERGIRMQSVDSADGVKIVYAAKGEGEPALVFIHGGLADRTFWSNQMEAFSNRYKVIALDLAGHGESGVNRRTWSLQACGHDVKAVIEAENVNRAVLIGNSMGGPVAAETALLAPDRVVGIVAVDTFHELDIRMDPNQVKARADAFRSDFDGSVKNMVRMLFHPDADPALMKDAEQRMLKCPVSTAPGMFESFANYDMATTARRLTVPIRCINGDLFPINFEANRAIHSDFDAIVLPHIGHYPMLECPEEFNRCLAGIVSAWELSSQ